MLYKVSALLDGSRIYNPDNSKLAQVGNSLTFSTATGSVIHSTQAVPAGIDFSFEVQMGGGATSKVGLCSTNTSNTGKEFTYTQSGTNGSTYHFDFYAATGRVIISIAGGTILDTTVPALVGKAIYIFGTSSSTIGSIVFNFGAAPFAGVVPYNFQDGIYSMNTNAVAGDSFDVNTASVIFQANGISYYNPVLDLGTAVGSRYQVPGQSSWTQANTFYSYLRSLQGGASSGVAEAALGEKTAVGKNSKDMKPQAVIPLNVKQRVNCLEQIKSTPYVPKIYWGDN